jgi:hypothetical protein
MSETYVKWDGLETAKEQFSLCSRDIDNLADRISKVNRWMILDSAGVGLKWESNRIKKDLRNAQHMSNDMAIILMETVEYYKNVEMGIIACESNLESVAEKDEVRYFQFEKGISKFGLVGITYELAKSLISSDYKNTFKYVSKGIGKLCSVFDKETGWKGLLGLNRMKDGFNPIEYINKKFAFSESKSGFGKVSTATNWISLVMNVEDVVSSNWEEFESGEIDFERATTEMVMEFGIETLVTEGLPWAVAALSGGAIPPTVTKIGVEWGMTALDTLLHEKIDPNYEGDIYEFVSDYWIDVGENISENVSNIAGEVIKNAHTGFQSFATKVVTRWI